MVSDMTPVRGYSEMRDSGIEWIGKIPKEWKIIKLKNFISGYKAGPFGSSLITDKLDTSGQILIYSPEHIAKKNTDLENNLYLPEDRIKEMGQFMVEPGDIIVPIVGSLGRAMVITKDMPLGIINQRLAKFRINTKKILIDYFLWLFSKSSFYSTFIDLNSRGSIILNLTKQIIYNIPIPYPSLEEQSAIAAYLDEKCSKIDEIIASAKASIEDYKQWKASIIYEAVTKGLDLNVEMKESGIEWIGKIPKRCSYTPLKYLLDNSNGSAIRVGPFGSALTGQDIIDEGVWVYNQRIVLDNNFEANDTFISENKANELKNFSVMPSDILITTRGSIGKIAIVPDNAPLGILHPCVIRFRTNRNVINDDLLKILFNESDFMLTQMQRMSNSTTIDVLYSYNLKELKIPVIPFEQQLKITEYLKNKCNNINRIINEKEKIITDLEFYKKSLIYEVVTGKRKVC